MRNFLITPPFALPLYILSISLWILDFFYLTDPYFEAISKLETHTDGESIAIGLGQIGAIPALPFIVLICFLILRNYPGCVNLLAWNRQKQWLCVFWSTLFLGLILIPTSEACRMLALGLPFNACVQVGYVYLGLAFRSILVAKTSGLIRVATSKTDPAYLICPRCKLEQWQGYSKCQKCGKSFA